MPRKDGETLENRCPKVQITARLNQAVDSRAQEHNFIFWESQITQFHSQVFSPTFQMPYQFHTCTKRVLIARISSIHCIFILILFKITLISHQIYFFFDPWVIESVLFSFQTPKSIWHLGFSFIVLAQCFPLYRRLPSLFCYIPSFLLY